MYEKTAKHEAFRFMGGVCLGTDVTREELLGHYHAVVYAVGSADDRRLGIPGEDLAGCHAATEFVAWYNGHPDYADHEFDLSAERAVVVGNGNVALDVARMLVLDPDELAVTDTADHAMRPLMEAGVREVVVLGRRGPVQAAFTNPELLELGELVRADVIVHPEDLELDEASAAWLESDDADAADRRRVEILRDYSTREPRGATHRLELKFLRSPLEVLEEDGRVRGMRVGVNRLEVDAGGRLRAVPTGEEEIIECGLVMRSIGYTGRTLPGVPFDESRGTIRNEGGRVVGEDGAPLPGEYAVGWIKRGPSGVIGTNKKDAADTVARMLEDAEAGTLNAPADADRDAAETWLRERVPDHVTWEGWRAIDEHELGLGEPHGRPRVKLVRVAEMLEIVGRRRG
jgi:ferredoxin--NADP+ reductase